MAACSWKTSTLSRSSHASTRAHPRARRPCPRYRAHGVFVSRPISRRTRSLSLRRSGQGDAGLRALLDGDPPKGSPEALRDPRGFATKFYTDQGNWDLVGNDLPVFFIRDAIKFPDMVHALKPSPVTNVQDPNRFFDFFSHIPESTNMLTYLYSDLGMPASYREMDGFGVHALKLANDKGGRGLCQIPLEEPAGR